MRVSVRISSFRLSPTGYPKCYPYPKYISHMKELASNRVGKGDTYFASEVGDDSNMPLSLSLPKSAQPTTVDFAVSSIFFLTTSSSGPLAVWALAVSSGPLTAGRPQPRPDSAPCWIWRARGRQSRRSSTSRWTGSSPPPPPAPPPPPPTTTPTATAAAAGATTSSTTTSRRPRRGRTRPPSPHPSRSAAASCFSASASAPTRRRPIHPQRRRAAPCGWPPTPASSRAAGPFRVRCWRKEILGG